MATPIGTLGTVPTLTVGDTDTGQRSFTDLNNIITLYGYTAGQGFATMRKDFDTSGYQVTSGKTLYIASATLHVVTAEATAFLSIGYGDTDVGNSSASAPTNPKYLDGQQGAHFKFKLSATGFYSKGFSDIPIPAGKFPFIHGNITAAECSLVVQCYER